MNPEMELRELPIINCIHHDAESTKLKSVSPRYRRSEPSRRNIYRQNSLSSSDQSSELSEASTTPLCPESVSSRGYVSVEETDHYYNSAEINSSSNGNYFVRKQDTKLPSIPQTEPPLRRQYISCKSSRGSSCSYSVLSGEKRTSPFISRQWLILITVISVVFSLLSIGFSVVCFVNTVNKDWGSGTFKEGDYQTCIACVAFHADDGKTAHLKSQLTMKMIGSKAMCCAGTSGQMSALIELLIVQQKNVNVVQAPSKQRPTFSPVSAHKHLHPWTGTGLNDPTNPAKHYRLKLSPTNEATSEHVRHVTAKNNSLEIQFSGWYLVYSSVHFKPSTDKPCSSLRYRTWGHFINKQSPNRRSTSGTLVQSAHTCCDNCTEDNHTSYAAGVFLLEAGDNVYIDVSGSGVLLFNDEGSYLGLAMLGSWDPISNKQDSDNNSKIVTH